MEPYILLSIFYSILVLWLSVYGLQAFGLTVLYFLHRDTGKHDSAPSGEWPKVAVQLPIFNERDVVERLIDAAAALEYPADKLEIQVLDDSTDDTTEVAVARAEFYRRKGVKVRVLHRSDRGGFKAGALAYGLQQTDAEYLAVFDADFRPHPDFLLRTVPELQARPDAGMAQTRWSHLNAEYSPLTHAQSMALDGHFVVEQTGRNRSGLLINFNGSAGVWRRSCIESAGGWQSDTMTEDMDLSYRAQLQGWNCIYLPDVDAPAELPPQMEAFKRQQARWAQGSVQCLRKLSGPIVRSRLTWVQKLMALIHISSYLSHPLMILLLLTSLPLVSQPQSGHAPFIGLGIASMGPPLLYAVSQGALYGNWKRRLMYFPYLAAIGAGIAWSTSQAVWLGLTRWGGTFGRTPKFHIEGRSGSWRGSRYALHPDKVIIGELALMVYAAVAVVVAWMNANIGAIPFLLLYVIGFGVVAGSEIAQAVADRRPFVAAS